MTPARSLLLVAILAFVPTAAALAGEPGASRGTPALAAGDELGMQVFPELIEGSSAPQPPAKLAELDEKPAPPAREKR